jgi:diguanylate cyclase (GGDEF)-like protein
VEEAIRLDAGGRLSTLALLDLDHFKRVNDTHGHPVGDAALLMLADLLRENLRPDDAIGRVGGEEFGILLAGLGPQEAATVCDRLRAALARRPVPGTEPPVRVTASIGLRGLDGAVGIEEAFRDADAALYVAKSSGRNRIALAA